MQFIFSVKSIKSDGCQSQDLESDGVLNDGLSKSYCI